MATLVVLAGRMIPTEEILKVSSRYLDWFRFYEFFFVKNPTNCPIIGLVPYINSFISLTSIVTIREHDFHVLVAMP